MCSRSLDSRQWRKSPYHHIFSGISHSGLLMWTSEISFQLVVVFFFRLMWTECSLIRPVWNNFRISYRFWFTPHSPQNSLFVCALPREKFEARNWIKSILRGEAEWERVENLNLITDNFLLAFIKRKCFFFSSLSMDLLTLCTHQAIDVYSNRPLACLWASLVSFFF